MKQYLLVRYFMCVWLMLSSISLFAQYPFGNEWIDSQEQHYKFKVRTKSLYRISYDQLVQLGLGQTPPNQLRIFRDGQQVPIFVSNQQQLGSGDYIEFFAYQADAFLDRQLYLQEEFLPNPEVNLITDSAVYFLTKRVSGTPMRLQNMDNIMPSPEPANASYVLRKAKPSVNVRTRINYGESYSTAEYFNASDFASATGYSYLRGNNNSLSLYAQGLVTSVGVDARLKINLANHQYNRPVNNYNILFNQNVLGQYAYNGTYIMRNYEYDVPLSMFNGTSIQVDVNDPNSHKSIYLLELIYPRNLAFSGATALKEEFIIPANTPFVRLGFNTTQGAPIMYNLDDGRRYVGVVQGNNVKYFIGNENTDKTYFISSVQEIRSIEGFQSIQFPSLASAMNANYILLSNYDYIGKSPNYIQQYADYRSSVQGGAHEVAIVNVEDLYNIFAYGNEMHPLAIKNFLKYAQEQNNNKIEHLFIVGKGLLFDEMYKYLLNPSAFSYRPIPTYGAPGSDNLFSAFDKRRPTIATGRLSSWSNEELGKYLIKVKLYEAEVAYKEENAYSDDLLWQKTALHIAGSSDQNLQTYLLNTLSNAAAKFESGEKGGLVHTFRKTSTDPVEQAGNEAINNYIDRGVNLMTFFGHASSSGFDYNLNNPDLYNANPRFPHFLALGCDVANIFRDPNDKTIGELYLDSEDGGTLTMIASNNYGYTSSLDRYMQGFYNQMTVHHYGATIGIQYLNNIKYLQDNFPTRFMDNHIQSLLLQGDPGLNLAQSPLADLAVLEDKIKTEESFVTTSQGSMNLIIPVYNFGKSVQDSILLTVTRQIMSGEEQAFQDSIWLEKLYVTDTLVVNIPLEKANVGMNNMTIHIDADTRYEEMTKGNNIIHKQIFVASEDIVPIYPHDFGIVYDPETFELKASTINTFAEEANYLFEIDTTLSFNSPFKQSTIMRSLGGSIFWKPNITLQNNQVYYWRVAIESEDITWASRSFIYLVEGSDGWNQSDYHQYIANQMKGMTLSSLSREFEFASLEARYLIENKVIAPPTDDWHNVRHSLNDIVLDGWGCAYSGAIHIAVFDSVSGQPWKWEPNSVPGSVAPCTSQQDRYIFEFYTHSLTSRNQAVDFINSIPDGHYVMIKNLIYGIANGANKWDGTTALDWKQDELVNGQGNSLYHTLHNLGFDQIDQFDQKKSFILFRKKGDTQYPVHQIFSADSVSKIVLETEFPIFKDSGEVASTIIGPAKKWKQLNWEMSDFVTGDESVVKIYGIRGSSQDTVLIQETDDLQVVLESINVEEYPYLKLEWQSANGLVRNTRQLNYWRVMYDPLPEIGLSPNHHFELTDSLIQGQKGSLSMAVHNMSDQLMDSVGFRIKIMNAQQPVQELLYKKLKPLPAHDSLHVHLELDLSQLVGNSQLIFEVNPDLEQGEQYYPNNIGQRGIFVQGDGSDPMMDVTFDGVYILDKDIVSAKPAIQILIKDENVHLPINDTSLFELYIQYPNQTNLEKILVDDDVCKFYPAETGSGTSKNEARIEYNPHFLEDGVYKLVAKSKDVVGNEGGGGRGYEVRFTVINQSTITNILNYPNPFSTSTQFVFTLTGSEVPSQFKVQIISVTGKVVREITQDELGPIRVGRNLTEYRWDGTDQYGQLLGNGVYLYRVVTDIKGEKIEHRGNEQIDQFFKNGYGKLYIMR